MKFENVLRWAAVAILILTVLTVVIGTLAVPLVLAFNCSFYWLFLYVAYTFIVVCCILYGARFFVHQPKHPNNSAPQGRR